MSDLALWLEAHDKLAGWAQFVGAMVALITTYLTAFVPIWHRKRQLGNAAARLLSHGFEVLESYHRTTPHFLPTSLTLRGGALAIGGVIDEIARFPIYEMADQGSRSPARHLVALNGVLAATRLVFESLAVDIDGREATVDEQKMLLDFLAERLAFVKDMLTGSPLIRPEWPTSAVSSRQ